MEQLERRTGTPRWVKIFALVIVLLIAVFVVVKIFGGGDHSPQRHAYLTQTL